MLNSKTYLYQRNGVFYIRLRMKSTDRLTVSHPSHNRYKIASVSLRTKDRRTAMVNKLLLAYLIGLVVTSTLIFIFSEEKVTYRLFAAIITGLTWPLSLIPSIISLMIRKSD